MKQSILVVGILGMILALSACTSTNTQQAQEDLQKPINCATAEGDIRALMSEKAHTSAQIEAGISAIVPIGLVVNAAKGDEKQQMKVASGDYNKMLDNKISEIKTQCGM